MRSTTTAAYRAPLDWLAQHWEGLLLHTARGRRVAMWGVVGLIMLGAAVGLASLIGPAPSPYIVFLPEGEPPGGNLRGDAAVLRDCASLRKSGFFRTAALNAGGQPIQSFAVQLTELAQFHHRDTVVIYVTGHSHVDAQGNIQLSQDEQDIQAVSLRDLLTAVRHCAAERKFLVLDIVRCDEGSLSGISARDVAALIPQELAAVKDPYRLTLTSCSPGQSGLNSETFHRTGFGYYFELALRGRADGWNDEDRYDGRVSAQELCRFVRHHVERWAVNTQGVSQTPQMLDMRSDFNLVAISAREEIEHHLPIAQILPRPYPKWLLAAWQRRDALCETPVMHRWPRLFHQFEHSIKLAEQQWRDGGPAKPLSQELETKLGQIDSRIKASQAEIDLVPPHALAILRARGYTPDPKVAADLAALLEQAGPPPPGEPAEKAAAAVSAAVAKFNQETSKAAEVDVAMAVVDALYRDATPTPQSVQLLDQLVTNRQPQPQYVETQCLHRLAAMSRQTPTAAWNTEQVRLAIRVMRLAETAQSAARPFAWTESPLTEAAQLRHNGEMLLIHPGYAPVQETSTALTAAASDYQAVLANQAILRQAYDSLDVARLRLPQYSCCLAFDIEQVPSWRQAIGLSHDLGTELSVDFSGPPLASKELASRMESIRQKGSLLSSALAELQRPWSAEAINEICQRSRITEDGASVARGMHALLEVPWLEAKERQQLWEAYRDLEVRLHLRVVGWDNSSDDSARLGAAVSLPGSQDESISLLERCRWAIDLLKLVDFPADEYKILDEKWQTLAYPPATQASLPQAVAPQPTVTKTSAIKSVATKTSATKVPATQVPATTQAPKVADAKPRANAPPAADQKSAVATKPAKAKPVAAKPADADAAPSQATATLYQLVDDVYAAYTVRIPQLIQQTSDPAQQVRLASVVPAEQHIAVLDTADPSPYVLLNRQFLNRRVTWLADHYLYLAHDLGGPDFNAEAARGYLAAGANVGWSYVVIEGPKALDGLSSKSPRQVAQLSWKRVGTDSTTTTKQSSTKPTTGQANATSRVVVYSPTDRVRATVTDALDEMGGTITLDLQLAPVADAQPPGLTQGVMVKLTSDGRDYHYFIDLPVLSAGPQLQILLSADPEQPSSPSRRLRLRPAEALQPYYLYVSNPTTEDHQVVVVVPNTPQPSPPLTVPAGKSVKVAFPAKPPKPNEPMPALADALAVQVLDAKTQQQLASWSYPLEVVSPRQYVRVLGTQFTPDQPGVNQLAITVRAFEMPPGPPCMVALTLSAAEIPGLMGVTSGVMRGMLPTDGTPLTLTAENLLLADGYNEDGAFYLDVDGVSRVFRYATTFDRRGDPTTPREQLHPRVMIVADEYARSGPGYKVTVHVDNAPDGSQLHLDLGQERNGVFAADRTRQTNQVKVPQVGFTPTGADGALLFSVTLDDWSTEFDATGIVGPRLLRARLIDPMGVVSRIATWQVVFDDAPPRALGFLKAPPQVTVNESFQVCAQAVDDITSIAQANFFLGKPEDGQPPKGAKLFAAKPINRADTQWQATLPAQKEAGPIDVSVQFTNVVGQSSYLTTSIEIVAAAAGPPGATIEGVVAEGPLAQAGLSVVLSDDKKAVQGTATTNAQGQFTITGVKPGKYVLSCVKEASQRQAQQDVEVKAGQTLKVDLSLEL